MKRNYLLMMALLSLVCEGYAQSQNTNLNDGEKISIVPSDDLLKLPQHKAVLSEKQYLAVQKPHSFSETSASAPKDPNLYGGWYIGVKALPLKAEKGTISLDYTDDSPRSDDFYSDKEIKKSSYAFNLDFGLQGGRKNAHHWEIILGGSFGSLLVRFYGQAGYGWNIPVAKGRMTVRPVLNLAYGNVRYKLGDMINGSEYIQVNDTKFYSDKVAVSAVTNPLAAIPRIDIPFSIGKKAAIKIFAGYHFTLSTSDPFIRFSGEDYDKESVTAKEKIKEANINLKINGIRIQKMPVDLDGFVFGLGVSF